MCCDPRQIGRDRRRSSATEIMLVATFGKSTNVDIDRGLRAIEPRLSHVKCAAIRIKPLTDDVNPGPPRSNSDQSDVNFGASTSRRGGPTARAFRSMSIQFRSSSSAVRPVSSRSTTTSIRQTGSSSECRTSSSGRRCQFGNRRPPKAAAVGHHSRTAVRRVGPAAWQNLLGNGFVNAHQRATGAHAPETRG